MSLAAQKKMLRPRCCRNSNLPLRRKLSLRTMKLHRIMKPPLATRLRPTLRTALQADGETEFEWNSVADMADLRNEAPADDMQLERGFTFEAVVAEELASSGDEPLRRAQR